VPFAPRMLLANLWIAEPAVVRLLEMQPEAGARLHTTIAPTVLDAGVKDNVLPPVARAIVNFRLAPRDSADRVVEHVRRAIDDPKVDIAVLAHSGDNDLKASDIDGPAYKFLAHEIAASFGVPVAPDRAITSTDARHYLGLADSVLRFNPFHSGPDDLSRVNGTNERLAVGDLAPAVAFYMRLIEDAK
jgi:carboxypeptidase PM20D1